MCAGPPEDERVELDPDRVGRPAGGAHAESGVQRRGQLRPGGARDPQQPPKAFSAGAVEVDVRRGDEYLTQLVCPAAGW